MLVRASSVPSLYACCLLLTKQNASEVFVWCFGSAHTGDFVIFAYGRVNDPGENTIFLHLPSRQVPASSAASWLMAAMLIIAQESKEIEAQVQKCRALQNAIFQARPCSTVAKTHWHAMPGPNLETIEKIYTQRTSKPRQDDNNRLETYVWSFVFRMNARPKLLEALGKLATKANNSRRVE